MEAPLSTSASPFDLLSPAQEESSPKTTSSPLEASSCSTSRSTSPAPPYESSPISPSLPSSPSSPKSRPPQVLSINTLSSVKQSPAEPAKQSLPEQSLIDSFQKSPKWSKLFDTLDINLTSIEPLTDFQYEVFKRLYKRLKKAFQ